MIYYILIPSILLILSNILILLFLKPTKKINPTEKKQFSIVIAIKNEAEYVQSLLDSLLKVNYPRSEFEVIIVDDNSMDNSFNIIQAVDIPEHFRIIKAANKKFKGKKGVLDYGISLSKFPIIVTFDGDCRIPEDILNQYNSAFQKNVSVVIGTPILSESKKVINRFFQFEHFRSRVLIFTSAILGYPVAASGANFAFKKETFIESGGYEKHADILSGDDDLFVQNLKKSDSVGILLNHDSLVSTSPPNSLMKYFRQKSRHVSASNYYSFKSRFLLGFWHILNIFALISPLLTLIEINFLYVFCVKIFFDVIITKSKSTIFKYNFNIPEIIMFQIIYELMLPIHYFRGTFLKIKWK